MKTIQILQTSLEVSCFGYGCMNLGGNWDRAPLTGAEKSRAVELVHRAKGATREAIALAWLLKHPAQIQPIIGTTNLERLVASCVADPTALSREEWFALLITARGTPLP